ncbi:MAG: polyphosphate kinase 1, partial [Spirochaetales bacterium]|nr:polyphosphate kinase 1 [Spirochaetales bacterium]
MEKQNLFINREISWLAFNERVLQEAEDDRNLLGDRIKFLSIFSSNQDEFFRVRVAMLKRFCLMHKRERRYLHDDPEEIMRQVQDIVKKQRVRSEHIYKSILQELKNKKIFILQRNELNEDQMKFVLNYFFTKIRPQIFPMMIDRRMSFPYLKDNSLYLAVELKRKTGKQIRYSIIEVPTQSLPRFIKLPGSGNETHIILIDEIVRCGLPSIYAIHNFTEFHSYNFKVTRDAEMEIDEDDISVSYLEKISEGLLQREKGEIIRFVYDQAMPITMLNMFISKNKIKRLDTLSAGSRYHKLKDFMAFPKIAGLPTTEIKPPFRHSR